MFRSRPFPPQPENERNLHRKFDWHERRCNVSGEKILIRRARIGVLFSRSFGGLASFYIGPDKTPSPILDFGGSSLNRFSRETPRTGPYLRSQTNSTSEFSALRVNHRIARTR